MGDIDEIAQHMRKLKSENAEQKKSLDTLRSQNRILDDRSRYLLRKLQEASALYDEAGRKVLDFATKQTGAVGEDIKDLKAKIKITERVSGQMENMQKLTAVIEDRIGENARRIEDKEEELGRVSGAIESIQKAISSMQKLPERFTSAQTKVEDGLKFFRSGMADVDAEIAEVSERIKPLESSLKAVQLYIPKSEKAAAQSVAAVDAKIEQTRADLAGVQNIIKAEMDKVLDKLKEKADAQGDRKSEDFRKLTKDFLAVKAEVDEKLEFLGSQFSKFSEIKERLKKEINADNDKFLRQLSGGLETLRGSQSDLLTALESMKGKEALLDSKIEQMKKLEGMIKEVRGAIDSSKDGVESKVEKALDKISADFSDFRKASYAETEALKEQSVKQTSLLEQLRKNVLEIEQELPALQSEIARQHAAMEKVNEKVAEAMDKAAEKLKVHSEKQGEKTKADFAECLRQFMEVREQVEQRLEAMGAQSTKFASLKEQLKEEINRVNDRSLASMANTVKSLGSSAAEVRAVVGGLTVDDKRLSEKLNSLEERMGSELGPIESALSSHEKAISKMNESFSDKLGAAAEKLRAQTDQQYSKNRESMERMTDQLLKVKAGVDEQLKFLSGQFSKFSDIKEKLKEEINRSNDKTLQTLTSSVGGLEDDARSLRTDLEKLKASNQKLLEELAGVEESGLGELQATVAKHEKTLSRINDLFDEKLTKAVEKLKSQAEQQSMKNGENVEKMFRDFLAVKSQVEEHLQFLTKQFSKFSEIKERLKDEINTSNQKQMSALERSVTKLQSDQSGTASAYEALAGRDETLGAKISALSSNVDSLLTLRKRQDAAEKLFSSQIGDMRKDLSGLSGFTARVDSRLEEMEKSSLKSVEEKISSMKEEFLRDFSKMKENLTRQATLIPSLEEKLEELESRKSGTGEIKHLKDMLQSMVEVSKKDVQELSRRMDRMESLKIDSLASALEGVKKDMAVNQNRMIRDFMELKSKADEKSDVLSEQFSRFDDMKERLKQEIRKENDKKIVELSDQVKALSRRLHDLQNELEHAEKDYNEAMGRLTEEVGS